MIEKKPIKSPPRNYFSRREQFRLLMLVMSLGLVVVLIFEASKPENWHWLTGEQKTAAQRTTDDDIDTSYQPTMPAEEPADTVRIVPNFDPMADEAERYFPGVVPAFLREIEDYAPFRPQESWSWYNLLKVLAKNDSDLINDASTGPASFVQLFQQPEVYRGELVSIRGTVRRVEWKPADKGQVDIPGYYRLIIRPRDGPARPIFVYVLNLPDRFATDGDIHEEIDVTGFFFKNWNYPANDTTWIAPVILARDFHWYPVPSAASSLPSGRTIAITLGAVAALAIFCTYGIYRRSRQLFAASSYRHGREVTADEITRLKDVQQAPPVGEQLRNLAARE